MNILVVDDDTGDRKLVRRMVLHLPPEAVIFETESGQQALEFSDIEFEAAFIDNLLPGSPGLDLVANFAETWPRTLLFVMSSQGDEDVAKNAILAGASDYIPKAAITAQALERMLFNGRRLAYMPWQIEEHQDELRLFSDVLVHDLRAPIRAIKFLCGQIMEDYEAGAASEVAGGFDRMKKSVQKMSDLIEQLDKHTHAVDGADAKTVPVASLFDGLQMLMAHDIAESGAQIIWKPRGLTISCSVPEVTQLLQNLIGNSIKYRGDASPRVEVSAMRQQDGNVPGVGLGLAT